jgi:hypothetical protein
MLRFSVAFLILAVVLGSCYRPSQVQAFKDMKVLEGTWTTTEGTRFSETWKVVNDSLIRGTGYSLSNGDTAFSEQLKIYRTGNFVLYAAKAGDSEDFIHFRLEEAGKGRWKFVNPIHDYPNVIEYKMENMNKLVARTANMNGNKVVEFKMKRQEK